MKNMRIFILILLAFTLSSCATMNLTPPNRWVDNNTLYSDNLPRLEIRVDDSMPFLKKEASDKLTTSTRGSSHTAKKTSEFFFKGSGAKLKIRISSLPRSTNWTMTPPDYSKYKGNIISGKKEMNGMRFATGIMARVYGEKPMIYKAYGRVVGETTRYHIYYYEKLEEEWKNYDPSLLTRANQDFLSAFSDRADKSFSIQAYSSQKQRSTSPKKPENANTQRLAKLESLYLDGILTKDEYEEKRDKIINNMRDE